MHQSRISKIESGEYDLRVSTLAQLADALNADLEIRLVHQVPREIFARLNEELCAKPSSKVWAAPTSESSLREERVFA